MNFSLELFFDEFNRKLDELEARWERRFSPPGLEQLGATQHVVADNWGGLFEDPARVVEEHDYEPAVSPPPMKEEQDAMVVSDNWGGLFEQPDHTSEERGHDLTADVVFTELASSVQIRISELEAEPVRLLDFRPIPVKYALSAKPVEPEYIPASDKELKAVIAQSNADLLLTERFRVSALDRDSLAQGALSAAHPPRRTRLRPPRLRQPRRAPLPPLRRPRRSPPHLPWLRQPRHALPRRVHPRRRGRPPRLLVRGCRPRLRARARPRTHPPQGARRDRLRRHRLRLRMRIFLGKSDPRVRISFPPVRLHAVADLNAPSGGNEPVFVGADMQRNNNGFAPNNPDLLRCVGLTFRLGSVERVLRATPLGGYDSSLDDDPESGFTHLDAPIDRAVVRDGQAIAAAAALRADAVGAAGGGQLQLAALGDLRAFVFPVDTTMTSRAPSLVLLYFSRIDVSGAVPADTLARLTYLREVCDAVHRQPPRRVRARRHAAVPTLLPPPDAATASPIPTPPRDTFWMVLAANLSKSGVLSVPAAQMFDEMWSYHSGTAGATLTWKFSGWLGCCALGFLHFMGSRMSQYSWSLHMHFDIACIEFAVLKSAMPPPNQMISQFVKPGPAGCNHELIQLIEQPTLYCKSIAQFLLLLPSLDDVHCSAYVQSIWLPPWCHCFAPRGSVVLPPPWPPDHSVWSPNSKLLVAAVLAPWDLGCSMLQLACCEVFQLSCHFFVLLEEFWNPVWLVAYTFQVLCNAANVQFHHLEVFWCFKRGLPPLAMDIKFSLQLCQYGSTVAALLEISRPIMFGCSCSKCKVSCCIHAMPLLAGQYLKCIIFWVLVIALLVRRSSDHGIPWVLVIARRTRLLLGVDKWGLILLPAYIYQGVFPVGGVHVLVAVTIAEIGATLWIFPVLVGLSNWLCSRLLWKPPWHLPALVEIIDAGLDDVVGNEDQEHEAADVVPAESTVPNAAAPPALPKDIVRLCLVPQKKYCANKRFPVTSNLRYMHGVLNVDEIKN